MLRNRSKAMLVLVVALLMLTVAASITTSPASARADVSALPTLISVKKKLGGVGDWYAYSGRSRVLGSEPSGCRSDQQMLEHRSWRSRWYHGRQKGLPSSIWAGAEIDVLRYSTASRARAAMDQNATYPRRCPKVTEWVCTECDGVDTTWRTRVGVARIGTQTVAWSFRQIDNFKSNGYTVLARRGATVVRVTAIRTRDVTARRGWRYPPLVQRPIVARLARMALRTAT